MKRSVYKTGILLLIAAFTASVQLSAEEVSKEYHKEYKAGPATALDLSNKYGDMVIQGWDKNEVVIDVKVKVELPNRERAEKLLAMINVDFTEASDLIKAETIIDKGFNFSGWSSPSRNFSITYSVKMPVAMALTLANRYGDTNIDELSGPVNIDIRYGDLVAGKLTRGNAKPLNKIDLAYGKATVTEAGWLDLYMRYAGLSEISRAQAVLLDSKYSRLVFGTVSSVVGESRYDNIRIENINNLDADIGYTTIKIGELSKKLNYSGSYGSFTVDRIPASFESVNVDTRYMGVKLGIDESASYRLEASVSYGSLNYDHSKLKVEKRIVENTSNQVAGIMGSENTQSKVSVSASYGSVTLN